eukprot:scaffold4097_cov306-Pinguiococcus_pyrenoidosus.AAC.5
MRPIWGEGARGAAPGLKPSRILETSTAATSGSRLSPALHAGAAADGLHLPGQLGAEFRQRRVHVLEDVLAELGMLDTTIHHVGAQALQGVAQGAGDGRDGLLRDPLETLGVVLLRLTASPQQRQDVVQHVQQRILARADRSEGREGVERGGVARQRHVHLLRRGLHLAPRTLSSTASKPKD